MQRKQWKAITEDLLNSEIGQIFRDPIDPAEDNLPDYNQAVKTPMDLTTVLKRVESGNYRDTSEWAADIHRVFDNSILYYGNDSYASDAAKWMKTYFQKRLDKSTLGGYEGWCKSLERLYTKLSTHMKTSPPILQKACPTTSTDNVTIGLTDTQLTKLAKSLDTVDDPNLIAKLCQLLNMYGAEIPVKSKRSNVNLRALPTPAQMMLWEYAKQTRKIDG